MKRPPLTPLRRAVALSLAAFAAHAGTTDLATAPLVTSPTSSVLPNILYILDDSGSMNWDFMPDWACASYSATNSSCSSTGEDPSSSRSEHLFRNSAYNGVYYNPAITYSPPTYYTSAGVLDTTTYPNLNGQSSTTGGDASATSASPNWKAVKNDGYGVQFTGTTNLTTANKYFYTYVAGEWCNSPSLASCQTTRSGAYVHPATLRWCNSSANSTAAAPAANTCQAIFNSAGGYGYTWARAPLPSLATISIGGTLSSTSVSSVKVNGQEILSATTASTSSANTLAAAIASNINKCTVATTGTCQLSGYTAYASGSNVVIGAPSKISYMPTITSSGAMTLTATAFTSGNVPGTSMLTVITADRDSYPYPGTTAKASTRTDCAGTTCTYNEEMTNYANWWAYYRTRMQMVKTAASQSFASIGSNYRVGYLSINNNTGSDFINLDTFNAANKYAWYTKFFSADTGSSTPLRVTLAKAGRLYAGKLNGTTLNGSTVVDPMQYSCQQNFTILSTDGYWNESSTPTQVNGSTSIGNQDASDVRPYTDGATVTYNKSTSQLQYSQTQLSQSTNQIQSRTVQIQSSTSYLQKQITQLQTRTSTLQQQTSQLQTQTSTLQQRTGVLQTRTSSNSGGTWSAWSNVASCTWDNSGTSRRQCQYVWGSWANAGSCSRSYSTGTSGTWSGNGTDCQYTAWSGWTGTSSCTAAPQSTGPSYTVATARQCQTAVTSPFANVGSCTVNAVPDGSGNTTQCQYSAWSAWTGTSSCSAVAQSSGPNYTTATARGCQSVVTSPFANAASCTTNAVPDGSGNTTDCQYTGWSAWTNAASCTPAAQSGGSPYAVGTAVQCRTTDTGWVGASACTPGTSNGGTVTCQSVTTGPTLAASCTPQTATSSNSWVQITCNNAVLAPAVGVASCTPDAPTALNGYVSTNCTTVTTGPASTSTCTPAAASSSNNYTTTTCAVASTTGGSSNTLADVAEYYYQTDLRTATLSNCTGSVVPPASTGNDVCSNDVPTSGQDSASWQHMTTFTLGLGASGFMQYTQNYGTATSGDYYSVKNGVAADPANGVCSWQSSGVCNWPIPTSNTQTTIDDLWHAGVNGRGAYFSAANPSALATGLSGALAGVSARLGASAAATTSNPNVTSGDNFVFSSTFTTQEWTGQLYRQQIDLTTGTVPTFDVNNTSTYDWAAQAQLDGNTSRTIYTYDASAGAAASKLKTFSWANLTAAEQAYFTTPAISALSQFCAAGVTCLSAADQVLASGANLVAFLAGDRTNEGTATDTAKYYRQRTHLLGDIVNAEAVYVKTPLFSYADAGYASFVAAMASRQGMVYAASNDGMLHAFNASTGVEAWAYVPALVLPNLYKLADKNYAAQHQYFADGTPVVGDICPNAPSSTCDSTQWRTILVAGLNRGGRGYYALDVTNPAAPKLLWEFTDTNMGYTYGNPVITKLVDGTWVVLVTSGYNNVSPGDGVGRLYVINAVTGALIRSISTGAGTVATPSGLARINAWVDNAMANNTTLRAYGGDLLGNMWRFDINDNVGDAGYEAERLVTVASDAAGATPQPITAKPEIGEVGGYAVVFFGTGRYLGASDLADTSLQSFYAVKDRLATPAVTPFSNPRSSGSGFIRQTETNTTCPTGTPTTICTTGQTVRVSTSNAVNFASDSGWFLDLPDSGERANTDPTLALGTLGFTTNVPNASACTAGGYSFRYFLDYRTGAAVSTSTTQVVSAKLGNALATRGVFVRLPNNTVVQLTRMSEGSTVTSNVPIGSGSGTLRRVSWRELVNE
ncbi:MAG: PilC/PilY family type IV pilus protein [Ignavibacteria bacterium]